MNNEFKIGVSVNSYRTKEEAKEALTTSDVKMAWREQMITINDFVEYATNGYTFCNLYLNDGQKHWRMTDKGSKLEYMYYQRGENKDALKITFKNDKYFIGAQVVFVDVDETEYNDFDDYVSTLPIMPQVCYSSYSDCDIKNGVWSRRFHLVYIFDTVMDRATYKPVSTALYEMIEENTNETISDKCGLSPVQYMNGCCDGEYKVYSYSLLSVKDVIEDLTLTNSNEYSHHLSIMAKIPNFSTPHVTSTVSRGLSSDIRSFDDDEIETFIKSHHNTYCYFYNNANPDEWMDISVSIGDMWCGKDCKCKYQIVDRDKYFALYYNISKVKDGNKRRKKLYERALLRRYMKPNVSANELFYNWVVDVYYDFEVDEDLTPENAVKNINRVMDMSMEELIEKAQPMVNKAIKHKGNKRGIIYKFPSNLNRSERCEAAAKIREKVVNNEYFGESVEDLKKNLEKEGIFVSERSIYRYVNRAKKISNKLIKEDIIKLYNPELSWNKNAKIMREAGYKITDKTLKKNILG